ncbi:MAG: hypothetical protein ACYC99_14500 [Candidatus Geothermincolia bacterium]
METARERKCVLCGAVLEGVEEAESGEFRCRRCGTTGRYSGVDLVAVFIPGYHRRLAELEAANKDLLGEIEIEGMKGGARDMRFLQKKHLERQDLLAEYAFLTHFREYIDKW